MEVEQGGIYFYAPPAAAEGEQAALVTTSGSEQSGDRPYVIVSRNSVNRTRLTAVRVPLSTRVQKANAFRILIPAAELIPDDPAHPYVTSVALCDHVRVFAVDRIRRKAGRVSESALRSIGLGLAYVLDIR